VTGAAALLGAVFALFQDSTVIAVAPVDIPPQLEVYVDAQRTFGALLAQQLRAMGFAVVPPETTVAVWLQARDSLGGYFDTYTGKAIPAKRDSVFMTMRRLLRDRHGAAAWLRPSLIVVGRPFTGGTVKWDGVEEESGGAGGLLHAFLGGTSVGTIPAASFAVYVQDLEGNQVYLGLGGIRLLARVRDKRFETVVDALATPERNAAAVHLALDSLPAKLAPTRRP
jgi:hypothetical protein